MGGQGSWQDPQITKWKKAHTTSPQLEVTHTDNDDGVDPHSHVGQNYDICLRRWVSRIQG